MLVAIPVCCRFRESYRSPKRISSCDDSIVAGKGSDDDEKECQRTISADKVVDGQCDTEADKQTNKQPSHPIPNRPEQIKDCKRHNS